MVRIIWAIGFLWATAPLARATPFLFAGVEIQAGHWTPAPPVADYTYNGTVAQDSLHSAYDGATFDGSGSAHAQFGVLRSYAQATVANYQGGSFWGEDPGPTPVSWGWYAVYANVSFRDDYLFTGGTGQGYLAFEFDITGNFSATGSSPDLFLFSGGAFRFTASGGVGIPPVVVQSDMTYTSPAIPFTFGQPFEIQFYLESAINFDDGNVDPSLRYDASAVVDLSHTAALSGMRVYADPDLTELLHNVTLTASSGTEYGFFEDSDAVPEPTTAVPLAIALAAFVSARRRRALS